MRGIGLLLLLSTYVSTDWARALGGGRFADLPWVSSEIEASLAGGVVVRHIKAIIAHAAGTYDDLLLLLLLSARAHELQRFGLHLRVLLLLLLHRVRKSLKEC